VGVVHVLVIFVSLQQRLQVAIVRRHAAASSVWSAWRVCGERRPGRVWTVCCCVASMCGVCKARQKCQAGRKSLEMNFGVVTSDGVSLTRWQLIWLPPAWQRPSTAGSYVCQAGGVLLLEREKKRERETKGGHSYAG
jgi:hypothetical protein